MSLSFIIKLVVWLYAANYKIPDNTDEEVRNVKFRDMSVNPQTEPCVDFQNFACGKFYHTTPPTKIPADGVSWTKLRFEQMDQKILDVLRAKKPASPAITTARHVFKSCTDLNMNKKKSSTNGFESVKMEFERLGFNPTRPPFASGFDTKFDHIKAFAKLLKFSTVYNNFFVMRIDVIEDPENAGRYVPVIVTDPTNSPKIRRTYADNITNYVYKTLGVKLSAAEKTVLDFEVFQTSTFMRTMQKITKSEESLTMERWTRMTLTYLQSLTDNCYRAGINDTESRWLFNWADFFDELLNTTSISSSEFVVYVTNYNILRKILEMLQTTDAIIFARALWLTAVQFVSPMSTPALQTHYLEKVKDPLRILELNRNTQCLGVIKHVFKEVVAHILVKNFTQTDKNELNSISRLVKEEFPLLIEDTTWLSDTAKDYLRRKMENVNISVPFLDAPRDEKKLIDDYQELQINTSTSTFYELYTAILVKNRTRLFEKILNKGDNLSSLDYQLPMPIFYDGNKINAYYSLYNKIEMSLVTIGLPYYYGPPFWDQTLGGFGFELARQMAHALDSANINRNEKGIVENRNWLPEDQKNFNTRAISIIQILVLGDKFRTNEDKRDMIVDSISLTVCFRIIGRVYSDSIISRPEEQARLFALAVGLTMCQKQNPKLTEKKTIRYVDYPDRLNEIFKKSAEFGNIFKCDDPTKGYTMNIRQKCAVFP